MNYSPVRKQSRRTQNDEMTTNQTTNSRANRSNRSKTEEVYEQFFPKPAKKKFIQHSIFLPAIRVQQKANRNNQYRSQRDRLRSRQDEKFNSIYGDEIQRSEDEDSQTMEYLNECQKVIENLKKLTAISTNRLDKKKPLLNFRNQSNQRSRNNTINLDDQTHNQTGRSQRKDPMKIGKKTGNQDLYDQRASRKIKSSFDQRESNVKVNEIKKEADSKNNQLSQEELKNQQELKKAQRKQKFLMKFLNKAKDRGCQLHKKIAEYKMKKNAEQKESEVDLSESMARKSKQEPSKQKKNSKQQKQQKNPQNLSKDSKKKLPDLKNAKESPTKSKKN